MKKLLFITCIATFAISCNNTKTADTTLDSTKMGDTKMAADTQKLNYPYTIDHPAEYWIPGNPKNAYNVLKSIKAFEDNKTDESASYFGDSVKLRFDGYRAFVSNDSLKKLFMQWRKDEKNFAVKMYDWESVIGNDKKEEWVTVWYKQTMTNTKGITDSLSIVDDCKLVNGKIVMLDEKQQHFPKDTK